MALLACPPTSLCFESLFHTPAFWKHSSTFPLTLFWHSLRTMFPGGSLEEKPHGRHHPGLKDRSGVAAGREVSWGLEGGFISQGWPGATLCYNSLLPCHFSPLPLIWAHCSVSMGHCHPAILPQRKTGIEEQGSQCQKA